MADLKPLVLDDAAQMQRLQARDDLDIPLNERVAMLEEQLIELGTLLLEQGIMIPDSIAKGL
jgi:hypothetical protein